MMLRNALRMTLATGLFATMASVGFAQSTTQGAIAGTAEDATGAAIPKATVLIKNDGTASTENLTADDGGYFKAPLLEPGNYTVTVSSTGFGNFQQKVEVVVGKLTEVMPKLTSGATETTVNVSADVPVMNYDSPDVTATLNRESIDSVPVQNRRWSALALTTPGVVADSSGFGLVSVRGMSTVLNTVLIDGADDNQAFYSEERGRTREAYSTSENAVQEFNVNTGVYSAQYGRAAGGVINSVTRSGSNQLHGELLFNDLDRGFGAYIPGSVNNVGAPLKPKDLRKIYGGSVGGRLIKDKLFWFYTYDQQSHINPGISRPKSNTFFALPDATNTTCNATNGYLDGSTSLDSLTCAMAARLGLTYAAAATLYGTGVAGLQTDVGTVQRVGYQEINTPKLDYQLNPKERVSFLFHRLRWDAPGDVQTNSTAFYSLDAWGTDFVKLDYGLAKLDSQISANVTNELLFQYSRELDDEGQQPFTPYTLANLQAPNGSAISGLAPNGPGGTIPYIGLATSTGFNLGSPYYSYRQALPDERKWQVSDVLYYTAGNHSIRFGGDVLHNYDLIKQTPYYFADYTYGTLANYLTDLATKSKAFTGGATGTCNATGTPATSTTVNGQVQITSASGPYACYSTVFQDYGATTYDFATTDVAGFVQDNWKVSPRLTFELGLRYDVEVVPGPTATYTTAATGFVPYAGLNNTPHDHNNFGPRIGFAFDVYGNGKTVLRGGYGLYYGRLLNSTIESARFLTGSPLGQYGTASLKPTTAGTPQFPNPMASGSATKPASVYMAQNLQNPQVDEMTVGVQQDFGKGTIFSLTYLGGLGRTLPNGINVNVAPPTTTSTITVGSNSGGQGPIPVGTTFQVPIYTSYINPNFTNIEEYLSNVNSSYNSMTADIQNHANRHIQFDLNYTWSHALDYNQNASTTVSGTTNNWLFPSGNARQNYGISQFNVGNRVVGYVLYNLPGIHGGGPLKYLTNGWTINDTFQAQNGLPYSANFVSGTGGASTSVLNTATWNGINGVTYLPSVGLNKFQVRRAMVDDVRLQKSFPIRERYNLQLSADMYNAANHQNFSTTDYSTAAYAMTATGANSSNLTFQPNLGGSGFGSHTTANDSGFLYTPREFQIQARIEF